MADPVPPLGIDLESIVTRVQGLKYFVSVSDIEAATVAIEEGRGIPPAAFVSIASETAEPNKLVGGYAQRVTVSVSALYCIQAARADDQRRHETDRVKRALILNLRGFVPGGAQTALEYDRFLIRGIIDGLVWGEVLMRTVYRLNG